MAMWCGFSPADPTSEESQKLDSSIISQMPAYPAEGSVKMIDDVLVVKFSD